MSEQDVTGVVATELQGTIVEVFVPKVTRFGRAPWSR